jgi:hypothetical protein
MDFNKLKSLVDKNIFLDIKNADANELRVNYRPGDDNCWFEVVPEKYKNEEKLATAINTEVEKKLYGERKTSIKI